MTKRLFVSFLFSTLLAHVVFSQNGAVIAHSRNSRFFHQRGDHRFHSNLIFRIGGPSDAPSGETPASIACIYGLAPPSSGCNIATSVTNVNGGAGTIVIIDAFDYPQAEADLATFSSQFGLPQCTAASGCFTVLYASGTQPAPDCGWAQEMAIDIEWAHAMAPNAKIALVEAASDLNQDGWDAIAYANQYIAALPGGSAEVSMSFGDVENQDNIDHDYLFQQPGVVYVSSAGDFGAASDPNILSYPATSPFVIAAGGTTVVRDPAGDFIKETAWATDRHCNLDGSNCNLRGCSKKQLLNGLCVGGGGGISTLEPIPSYQSTVSSIVGSYRGTPDLSADANPDSGVSVYDSFSCGGQVGWQVFGGTSVSAPLLAGIINTAGNFRSSSAEELAPLYSSLSNRKYYNSIFQDITRRVDGQFRAVPGYDLATGLGTPKGLGPLDDLFLTLF
jgi:kumamolisin